MDTSNSPTVIDPTQYWTQRHRAHDGLRGVGNIGCSESYNRWLYRAKQRVFRREARLSVADPAKASVLDIGSGRGSIVEQWMRLGCRRIVGSDFAEPALIHLRNRFPSVRFTHLDIGKPLLPFKEEFDAVSAMDVLYHLMDEAAFGQACDNVFRALRPGGVFIFSDLYPDHGQVAYKHHTVRRQWQHAHRCLTQAGFVVRRRRPLYVFMENPSRSDNTLFRLSWKVVSRLASGSDVGGAAAGAVLFPFELLAATVVRRAPGLEIFTCQKPF